MPIADDIPLALANRFTVKVDAPGEIDLGSWAKVDGLDATFDVVEYHAGDAVELALVLPGRNEVLDREAQSCSHCRHREGEEVVERHREEPQAGPDGDRAQGLADKPVFTWEMRSAMPSKWSVSGFDAGTSKIATEQLEIVHLGFLDDDIA